MLRASREPSPSGSTTTPSPSLSVPSPQTAPEPALHRGLPLVLYYPIIDPEIPLGPSADNPMGEGSEDTAAPMIDPADARQGRPPVPPEPLP